MNRGFKAETQDSAELYYILKKDVSGETGDTGNERIDEPAKIGAKGSSNADEEASNVLNEVIVGEGADYLKFKQHKTSDWSTLNIPKDQP